MAEKHSDIVTDTIQIQDLFLTDFPTITEHLKGGGSIAISHLEDDNVFVSGVMWMSLDSIDGRGITVLQSLRALERNICYYRNRLATLKRPSI